MEDKKSSIGSKIGVVLVCLFAIFFVIFVVATFNMMAFDNVAVVAKYNDKRNEPVEAVITEANEIENDDGNYWCSFVSYTYNGVEYKDVFYDNPTSEPRIGTEVLVHINPENPDEIVPDKEDAWFSGISSFIILSIILGGLYIGLYILIGALITCILEKCGSKKSGSTLLLPAVVLAVKQIIESVYFYKQYDSFLYAILSAIIILLIIVSVAWLKQKEKQSRK